MHFNTADLCDKYPNDVHVLKPLFQSYGGISKAMGKIVTLKLPGNNSTLAHYLKSTQGEGNILVIDVEEDFTAVVGENMMKLALENNWAALLINGYVRDTHYTKEINVGLFALGVCPKKIIEPKEGVLHVKLHFAGIAFNEGDYLYADEDGIIVSPLLLQL